MKILRKIKVHSEQIFSYIAIVSMVVNAASPFAAIYPTKAFAEDTAQSSSSEAPVEETHTPATTQEPAQEPANTPTITETPTEVTVTEPETPATEPATTETPVDQTSSDTQPGDILPDGASDYRPEADVTTPDTQQTAESAEPVILPADSEPAVEVSESQPAVTTETSTTEPAVVEEPKEVVKEFETLADSAEIKDSTAENWNIDGEKAVTTEVVKLGIKYIFPLDKNVTVTFTKLPKLDTDRTTLKIERIKVTDLNLPGNLKTDAEYAYDITTGMINGEFEYNLTLPKPDGADAGISYIEKNIEEIKNEGLVKDDIKEIDENKIDQSGNEMKVDGIDHFTTYFVDTYDSTVVTTKSSYLQGETVYAKGTSSDTQTIRLVFYDNQGNVVQTCPEVSGTLTTCNYILSASANTGTWRVEIERKNNGGQWGSKGTASFNVAATSVTNPSLPRTCGLDIALVLDNSTSIDSTELSQMKSAMTAFVNALNGTPTQFSVTKFATLASVVQAFTSNATTVNNAINAIPVGGGYTNWQDGFTKAKSTLPNRSNFDLVIFASDGNPNRTGTSGTTVTEAQAVADAKLVSDSIKSGGARILGIGIGTDLNSANMEVVTGPNINTGDITTSDLITTDFSGLAAQLANFAKATCGGTISVNKYIDTVSDGTRGGSGWTYHVAGPSSYAKDLTTSSSGQANTGTVNAGSGYSITETNMLSGYSFGSAICRNQAGATVGSAITNGWGSITVGNDDIISCDFVNTTNYVPVCGNGIVDAGEQCDGTAGIPNSDFVCTRSCTLELVNKKIDICHATDSQTNPYIVNQPDKSADVGGHDGHNGPIWFFGVTVAWGDIIPPFNYIGGSYAGKNWTTEGQAIYQNDCNIPKACGNHIVETSEQCDDGNLVNGDGCSSTCQNETGDLRALKVVDDGSDLTQWKFSLDGGASISADENGLVDFGQISIIGPHYITELGPISYHFGSITGANCTANPSAPGIADATVVKDGTTTCTFTNEINKGSITIIKDARPNSGQDFNFTTSGNGLSNFSLDDDSDLTLPNSQTFKGLFPGHYTVAESSVEGWDQSVVTCDSTDGSDTLGIGSASISLSAGESVTCTFVNTQRGSITIIKDTQPNDPDDITFHVSGPVTDLFNLDDDEDATLPNTETITDLPAGTYTVLEEYVDRRLTASSITCSDDDSHGNLPTAPSATIILAAGEHVTCTFVNSRNTGTLIVKKVVVGSTTPASDFYFQVDGGALQQFEEDGQNEMTVKTYNYTITEPAVSGFTTTYDNCTDVWVETDQTTTCTITNTRNTGTITIDKVTNPIGDNTDFIFNISSTDTGIDHDYFLKDQDPPLSGSFATGVYTIEEKSLPAGWSLSSLVCSPETGVIIDGSKATFDLDKDEHITCTFTNKGVGKIVVLKEATGGDDTFSFWLRDNTGQGITDSTFTTVDGHAEVDFNNVKPGSYRVGEVFPSSWFLADASCVDETGAPVGESSGHNAIYDITINPGSVITCTFDNTKYGRLIVDKVTDPSKDPQEFAFTYNKEDITQNFNLADQTDPFDTPIFPGTWSVSEDGVDGWNLTDISCTDPTGKPVIDLENGEATVDIAAGETVTCTFTNTKVGSVTVYKFNDLNGNGIKDEGEPTLSDWGIVIGSNGCSSSTQNTDGSGSTVFNLVPGDYSLSENSQVGWTQTAISCNNEPAPKPESGIGVCHWNEGKDEWNALGISVTNPGHIGNHPFDYPYNGPAEYLTGKFGKLGDAWCEANDPRNQTDNLLSVASVSQDSYPLNVKAGSNITCYIGNVQLSDVHGYKWNDLNGDGIKDENEPLLGDWRIFIDANDNQTFDQGETNALTDNSGPHFGWYVFTDLLPGTYSICEQLQAGWTQTYPVPSCHSVTLPYTGESEFSQNEIFAPEFDFGNVLVNPILEITKVNDTGGNPRQDGDIVTYTITVKALDGDVKDVQVTDLLPLGFSFVHGSSNWSAVSSTHGVLSISEPTYASPGVWSIGDLDKDEVVTLTYKAQIGSTVDPGIYPDLAWTEGTDILGGGVLGLAETPGKIIDTDNFVGTEVLVVAETPTPNTEVDVKEGSPGPPPGR